jgi:SAM-dependent methyltransferase
MNPTSSPGEFWDQRYSVDEYAFGTEANDFLRDVAADLTVGDTLVLGDGEGRNGVFLAQLGHRVTTIDLSPVGVDKSRRLAAERGVTIDARVADLSAFDMGTDAWNAIVSIFCHVPSAVRVGEYASIRRALRPGGRFVLESYDFANVGRGVGGPQDADLTVELAELEAEFEGWTLEVHRAVERPIKEGPLHDGLSSVVQFVAVKPI